MSDGTAGDIELLRPGQDFDAVVIGASAGALEALQMLLPHLRCRSMAFVIAVHLPVGTDHGLIVQLQGLTPLRLKLAEDAEDIEPGVVYLAPAGRHLMVDHDETFELVQAPLVNYARPSIDVLFESAADTWGRRTVGVILTGSNEDGAKGLKEIGAAGGLTLVQDPASAKAPYMPAFAIRTARPAAVLSLEAMTRLFDAWTAEEAARPPPAASDPTNFGA
jgi:two-component system chemotaxis response regulator CheB